MKQGVAKVKERYNWPVTILLIIGIVLIILLPLYMALMIAIKDPSDMNNVLALPRKLRLQNFADAWVMTDFPRKFFNTAFITVINLFFTLITNSFAAYAITRNRKKSKFFSIMYYYFISAMFIPFQVIMLPLVVQANAFHLDNIYGITFLYVIFGLPMNTFLYTGAIKAIPEALDEAAMIDGAGSLKVFYHVAIRLSISTILVVFLFSFVFNWNETYTTNILTGDALELLPGRLSLFDNGSTSNAVSELNEAIKMADRICIIQNGQIAQFDRPEEILKRPANAYVEEFVGKNRLWGNPAYIHAEDIMKKAVIHISKNRTVLQALQIMRHNTVDSLLVTSGREHRLEGIVWLKNLQEVKDYSASLEEYITQDYISVYADTSLQEIIDTVDYDASGIIPVVNHENELLGGLTKSGLLATLSKRYRRDSTEGAEE